MSKFAVACGFIGFLVFLSVLSSAIMMPVPGIPAPPKCTVSAPSADYMEVFYSEVFEQTERQAACNDGDRACENTVGGCRHRSCQTGGGAWNEWVSFGSGWSCKSTGSGPSTDYRCAKNNQC